MERRHFGKYMPPRPTAPNYAATRKVWEAQVWQFGFNPTFFGKDGHTVPTPAEKVHVTSMRDEWLGAAPRPSWAPQPGSAQAGGQGVPQPPMPMTGKKVMVINTAN